MKKLTELASGSFLKAINVTNEQEQFEITAVEEAKSQGGKDILRVTLVNKGNEWDFDFNQSNLRFLIDKGMDEPLSLIGRKVVFKKVFVINPTTKKEVEGLRIKELI